MVNSIIAENRVAVGFRVRSSVCPPQSLFMLCSESTSSRRSLTWRPGRFYVAVIAPRDEPCEFDCRIVENVARRLEVNERSARHAER